MLWKIFALGHLHRPYLARSQNTRGIFTDSENLPGCLNNVPIILMQYIICILLSMYLSIYIKLCPNVQTGACTGLAFRSSYHEGQHPQ